MVNDIEMTHGTAPERRLHRTLQDVHRTLGESVAYGSFSCSEETPLHGLSIDGLSLDSQSFTSHHRSRGFRGRDTLLLAVLVMCIVTTTTVLLHAHSDYDDMSLLSALDIPLLGSRHRAERYQKIGEDYLSNPTVDEADLSDHKGLHIIKPPEGCEATVILLRHCDKGHVFNHCSYLGYERAVHLSTLFGDEEERWPSPSYIFALAPGGRHNPKKNNFREVETIEPLAEKVNIQVDDSYTTHHTSKLAKRVLSMLRSGEMCGKVAIVNWKHSDIPHLAHKLGCGPGKGCPLDYPSESFGQAWQIKFVYKRQWHSTRKSGRIPKSDKWMIFGSVQQTGFDPLSFSKKYGDYKPGGTDHGARWSAEAQEVTERSIQTMDEAD